ncbi:hypothetical protein [Bradyrhizobium sp. LA7.1]|uniref:hypothetical protein n=1 Tax=Bradyrhizobium sp. LA7.1 TaxID=3156324 RepID=UPI003390884D
MDYVREIPEVFASIGHPGPNPKDARLELFPPKTWVSKTTGKVHVGRRYWHIVDGPFAASTKCPEDQKPKADKVFKKYFDKKVLKLVGEHAPDKLTFKEILQARVENARRQASTPAQKRTAENYASLCSTLIQFFGEMTLKEYKGQDSLDFRADYIARRSAWYDDHPDTNRKDPSTTADRLLKILATAVSDYIAAEGILWSKEIYRPKKPRRPKIPRRWLRKPEAILLLMACRYRYDKERGCFLTQEVVQADGSVRVEKVKHDEETLRERYYISRLIRYAIQTGKRHEAIFRTVYGNRPDMPGIDCDSEGSGTIYRCGYAEAQTSKSGPPSPIHRKLRCMVRIWAKMDGYIDHETGEVVHDGLVRHLIRNRYGLPYEDHLHRQFARLVREVGLQDVSIHTLKHTAVNYCYQADQTRKATSKMLGTTEQTLNQYYTDWRDESDDESVLKSFDNPERRRTFSRIRHHAPLARPRPRRYEQPFRPTRRVAGTPAVSRARKRG